MIKILDVTGARGAYFWDINDYYIDGYFTAGNPVNDKCKWTNQIAEHLGLPHKATYNNDVNCANY
jgi:hypothetical protein